MAMTEVKSPAAPKIGWFDRAILAVAPMWGARRIATRRAFEAAESGFSRIEAAENNDSRGNRWLISRLSPDSQLEQDLATVRDRSRDIYQNDAMGGAVDNKVNHIIGTGHTPQARVQAVDGLLDETEAEAINTQAESVYERWEPRADRSGRRSLWMLSRLAERHNEVDGESFTVLSDVGRAEKVIPLALQVIDPVRVETPAEFAGDSLVRLGIRYDASGEILGYFVRRTHPGDTKSVDLKYDFIPADRMLHVFEPWFAEQTRGLPWMTRALNRARDAKDFDEATILAAQVEACFAAFVKPALGSGFLSATGAATGTTNSGKRLQDLVPGTISHLDPGEDIAFASPQRPGGMFVAFQEWNYRRVAAAINWPYEMVVKNWNGLSFSAGRLVLTDAKKSTEVGQKIMREMWFSRVWCRMVEEAVIVGEVEVDILDYVNNRYEFERHVWIPPKWEYALNPGEEVSADVEEIAANLATLEDKLGKRGYDLESLVRRKARENKILIQYGLKPIEPPPNGSVPRSLPGNSPPPSSVDSQADPTIDPVPAGVAA
jgi:lambda family phage portal protein